MKIKKYVFASLRGEDFEVEGVTPLDAWQNLCSREAQNGSLWKTSDKYRNEQAVKLQGFKKLNLIYSWVAYKEIE